MPVNKSVFNFWRRLDVSCIFIISICLTITFSWFVLPPVGISIITLISIIAGLTSIYRFWLTEDDHKLDGLKHTLFIATVKFCYLFPIVFALIRDIINKEYGYSTLGSIGVLFFLAIGGIAYATGFPQNMCPGKFDTSCHSHLMMHYCMVMAYMFGWLFTYANYKRIENSIA